MNPCGRRLAGSRARFTMTRPIMATLWDLWLQHASGPDLPAADAFYAIAREQ